MLPGYERIATSPDESQARTNNDVEKRLRALERGRVPGAWINFEDGVTLSANVTRWSAAYQPAYMRDPMGFVHLRGLIKGNGVNLPVEPASLFTLPEGYRPEIAEVFFSVFSYLGASYSPNLVRITSAGVGLRATYATPSSGGYLSLDGITFRAAAV